MKDVIVAVVVAIILFEVLEHVVLPLVWLALRRRKKGSSAAAITGRTVEVREWDKTQGLVYMRGELWKAVSDGPLSRGDKVVVRKVEGLTLSVAPLPQTPSEIFNDVGNKQKSPFPGKKNGPNS